MAKNEAPPPAPAGDQPPKKKNFKLMIMLAAALVLFVVAAGAAFLILTKHHDGDDAEAATSEDKPKKKKADKDHHKPAYLSLEPFTVNLLAETGDQYLQLALTLDMEDEPAVERAKAYTPKLRNDITLMLSGKKPADISGKEGKEALAKELRAQVNGVLDPEAKGKKAEGPVREVLFTSFIIQ